MRPSLVMLPRLITAVLLLLFTLLVWARWNVVETPFNNCVKQYHRSCYYTENGDVQPVLLP